MGQLHSPVTQAVAEPSARKALGASGNIDALDEQRYWMLRYRSEPYYDARLSYAGYAPAFRLGISLRLTCDGKRQEEWQSLWERQHGASRLGWHEARKAIEAAWQRVDMLARVSAAFTVRLAVQAPSDSP